MAKYEFSSDNQPKNRRGRGKSKKTLVLDAIIDGAMIGFKNNEKLSDNANRDRAEQHFFSHIASRAFNPDDDGSIACLNLLANKGWSNVKASYELVEFEFDSNLKPHEQASQALDAVSKGSIAPDVASVFINSIATTLRIEEVTELAERMEEIEKSLGIDNG